MHHPHSYQQVQMSQNKEFLHYPCTKLVLNEFRLTFHLLYLICCQLLQMGNFITPHYWELRVRRTHSSTLLNVQMILCLLYRSTMRNNLPLCKMNILMNDTFLILLYPIFTLSLLHHLLLLLFFKSQHQLLALLNSDFFLVCIS